MFFMFKPKLIKKAIFICICSTMTTATNAVTLAITADYKPGSDNNPRGDRFINTTPCFNVSSLPSLDFCDRNKIIEGFTIVTLPAGFSMRAREIDGALAYFKTGGPRRVTLTNTRNSEKHEVTLIPTHIGAAASSLWVPVASTSVSPFDKVAGDCGRSFIGNGYYINENQSYIIREKGFLYDINSGAQSRPAVCKTISSIIKDDFRYYVSDIFYGFKLEMPNPLKMSNGTYTGTLKQTIGKNQDIDVGPTSNGGIIDVNFLFTLTVEHQLKVVFPTSEGGSNSRVALLPVSGWHHPSRKNFALDKKLPLRISYSSPYMVSLVCQYKKDDSCALKNSKGHTVKLDTTYVDERNSHRRLSFTYPTKVEMSNGKIITDREAFMLFRVEPGEVKTMLDFPGSTYKGDVSFIFDASI
ncbi:hypothetical protein [Aeromonas veronii]|uniref:hypothetical protein n=1 Tax=Aeromonas veronii TaxID=654 RepID=UPI003BA289D5